jgi:peptide/nickel transport system substrate-binding protein
VIGTARSTRNRSWLLVIAVVLVLALVAAACGGGDDDDSSDKGPATTKGPDTNEADAGKPVEGGSIVYGLEADTAGGFCLAEAQLAIAGIQVARTLYDTLTAPDADGNIKPYLAESVTSNKNATEWTIKLRPNIKFSDGSALDATVVKNNLDAYRGTYPARQPLLFTFVFSDVSDVTVVDPLTVKVTTKRPWPAFPWFLHSSGRLGMMGQKQLDAKDCNKRLIGTGPFMLKSWTVGDKLVAVKNPNYWQKDADGNQLPYLNQITYVPQESGPDRVKALQAGDFDVIHTSGALEIEDIRNDSKLAHLESDKFSEVAYTMLNATKAPFDNQHARNAVAYAIDRDAINKARNHDLVTNAAGPFTPGTVGFLDDSGLIEYDPAKAKSEAAEYKKETGQDLSFTYTHSADPETTKTAELQQSMWKASGINVNLRPIGDQSQLINIAIGRDFQAVSWRNHPGADPDTQYVWWHCGNAPPAACDNPVNFGGFNDATMNKLMDDGRVELDPAKRKTIYEDLNREFAKKLYNLWGWYVIWDIASNKNVHGILGPNLPDGSKPFEGLATGHPVLGMWVSK